MTKLKLPLLTVVPDGTVVEASAQLVSLTVTVPVAFSPTFFWPVAVIFSTSVFFTSFKTAGTIFLSTSRAFALALAVNDISVSTLILSVLIVTVAVGSTNPPTYHPIMRSTKTPPPMRSFLRKLSKLGIFSFLSLLDFLADVASESSSPVTSSISSSRSMVSSAKAFGAAPANSPTLFDLSIGILLALAGMASSTSSMSESSSGLSWDSRAPSDKLSSSTSNSSPGTLGPAGIVGLD